MRQPQVHVHHGGRVKIWREYIIYLAFQTIFPYMHCYLSFDISYFRCYSVYFCIGGFNSHNCHAIDTYSSDVEKILKDKALVTSIYELRANGLVMVISHHSAVIRKA